MVWLADTDATTGTRATANAHEAPLAADPWPAVGVANRHGGYPGVLGGHERAAVAGAGAGGELLHVRDPRAQRHGRPQIEHALRAKGRFGIDAP